MRSFHRLVLGALILAAACSSKKENTAGEDACVTAQPLTATKIFGTSLAAKQIALTFDDGPGTRTLELSTYLKNEGIRAGFFVNGKFLGGGTAALAQLVADGHVVANHTQNHPDLRSLQPAQVVNELAQTDTIIAPFVPANRYMFRAPFGFYTMPVYDALQASAMSKYVGHIEWDIGGQYVAGQAAADFDCWQSGAGPGPEMSAKSCGDLYRQQANTVGKGIVLLHDADYGTVATNDINVVPGNTVLMTKYLVPLLKADGFTFVRIDEVPEIAALLPPLPPPADGGTDGSTPIPMPTTTTPPPPPPPCP